MGESTKLDETYNVQLATAVMDGHIAPLAIVFPIGEELRHEILERKASLLEHACLPVLGKYHILWRKGRS